MLLDDLYFDNIYLIFVLIIIKGMEEKDHNA